MLRHASIKTIDHVFGMKKWYDERVENKDDCHFNGYKKLNINGLF
jgi:hypothetical protein